MKRIFAHKGKVLAVEFAIRINGESPASDFYDELDDRDKAKLLKLFETIGEHGQIRNKEKFKHIEGTNNFFVFKSFQIRMPCFRFGYSFVVTHGYIKKADKMPPAELKRAEMIKDEHEGICKGMPRVHKSGG